MANDFTKTKTHTSLTESTRVINLNDLEAGGKLTRRMIPTVQVAAGPDQGRIFSLEQTPKITIGRAKENVIVLMDPSCSRAHAEITWEDEAAGFVTDLGSTNGTKINGEKISGKKPLVDGDRVQLGDNSLLKFALIPDDELKTQLEVYQRATRDGLTKAYNRPQFEEILGRELSFQSRSGQGLGLIMMDVDFFKKINDSFGHLAGDEVLRDIGKRIPELIRNEDVFARIGGEEFTLLSRTSTPEGLHLLAERIRTAMEEKPASFEGRAITFTVSIGTAFIGHKKEVLRETFLKAADEALYESKGAGRNRCTHRIIPA